MSDGHYVYLYRSLSGVPKYVGYGMNVDRSLSHAGHSHNDDLRRWLERGDFNLTVAGPYRDAAEGKHVEAALISALNPEFNRSPGEGPRFLPLGVPPELGERPTESPLTLAEIGRVTGGALLVYLAPGDFLRDGRKKYDPAAVNDEVVVANIEGFWDLARHREEWTAATGPKVLVGIHGKNVKHRFVAGACRIDTTRWFADELEVPERHRWRVPLVSRHELDVERLRGRRVEGVKFGQFSWQLHIWVDGDGNQRHPAI